MLFQRCPQCCNIGIVPGLPDKLIVDAIIKEAKCPTSSLNYFVHVPQVINSNTLYSGCNHIPNRQHTGKQGRGEHQGKNNQYHLCSPTGNVAHTNLKKDGIAEC